MVKIACKGYSSDKLLSLIDIDVANIRCIKIKINICKKNKYQVHVFIANENCNFKILTFLSERLFYITPQFIEFHGATLRVRSTALNKEQ